jgi:predicted RNase H-like HicB family nuclease
MSIRTYVKYLLSFSKKDWDIEDYPIEVYLNKNAGEENVKYGARILNWAGMVGHGSTKELAIESLKEHFLMYKDNNEKVPRPGTNVPLKFASTEKIDMYEEIAVDFFRKVFNADYYDGFFSDQSWLGYLESLIDDEFEQPKEVIIERVKEIYQVDITDIYDKPLWMIFECIEERATDV